MRKPLTPHNLWVPLLLACSACAHPARSVPHAPPEEAAKLERPLVLPEEGLRHIEGNMAASIQLAMEDFLPLGAAPDPGSPPEEACLFRRESYEVAAVRLSEGVMLVRFILDPNKCDPGESIMGVITYAVDLRTMSILAVGEQPRTVQPAPGT